MTIAAILLASATPWKAPSCRRGQLSMTVSERRGVADLVPVSGAVVSVRNEGPGCVLPADPTMLLRDLHGGKLPASRVIPPGLPPGPPVASVFIRRGHRATFELTWPYCPDESRCARMGSVTAAFGSFGLHAPVAAAVGKAPDAAFGFHQSPGRAAEGTASERE